MEEILNFYPELIASLVGIIGLVYLLSLIRQVGAAMKNGFMHIAVGLAFGILAMMWLAVSELQSIDQDFWAEAIFEILIILSFLFITLGPKVIHKAYKKILPKKKKK